MSGGHIESQQKGDHQMVVFTFIGEWTDADRDHWNQAVVDLKHKFPHLVGVTFAGKSTPPNLPAPTVTKTGP